MTPLRADSRIEEASTIEDQRQESRQAFMGTLENMRASLKPFIPSLGGLDFDAGAGAQHVGIPSDLFTVSVRSRHDPAQRPPDDEGLQVVISPIRTEARQHSVVGRAQVVVASLTPMGMLSVFKGGFDGMVDRPVPLSALCGELRERDLIRALDAASTLTESCEAFTRWLEAGIVERGALSAGDLRVARTALLMSTAEVRSFELSELAHIEGVTRRQLERDFGRHLGVSPGSYGRIVRFQRAAASVAKGQPLLHAAIDNGYADQAHMNRTFKEFTGMTPSQLAAQGARPGQDVVRAGLAGRVFLFDVQSSPAQRSPAPASSRSRPVGDDNVDEEDESASFAA
jgi:AraC-like DNA-binding protein